MKKQLAALAAAFLLMTGTASAADGSVEGKVRGPMDLGLEVIVRDSGTGNWDRGRSGVGVAIGGEKKKVDKTIELQLISRAANLNALSQDELTAWYKDGIAPTSADVFITRSAEDGTYSFTGVPEGSYYLVILMPGGGNLAGETDRTEAAQELRNFLRNWDMYQLFTIGMKLYTVHTIDVKADSITKFDYGFAAPGLSEKGTIKKEQ
jgi:hypothetical protein